MPEEQDDEDEDEHDGGRQSVQKKRGRQQIAAQCAVHKA